MASKTIDHMDMYVAIAPYEHQGQKYNELNVTVAYRKGVGFNVHYHPGYDKGNGVHTCIFDFSKDPLTSTTYVEVKAATKNSVKTLEQMRTNLEAAKDAIAWLFDHRDWTRLQAAVKNIALFGYHEKFRQQMEELMAKENDNSDNQDNNQSTSNSTIMAKKNESQAQAYVGKTIVIGENTATIVINQVEGDKLNCTFTPAGKKPMSMPIKLADMKAKLESGVWKLQDGAEPIAQPKQDEPSATFEVVEGSEYTVKDDEGKDVTFVSTAPNIGTEEQPKAKTVTMGVQKPASKNGKTKSTLKYETYMNKKGKTCARIVGFREDDAAYQQAAELHASATYERTKQGGKVYLLIFGPRYAQAAKKVWSLLDVGGTVEQAKAIIDGATEERLQQREEWKQKRAAYQQQRESQTATAETTGYTDEQVAAMLRQIMAGGEIPAGIKEAMAKAA